MSSFYEWLELQQERWDPVGDLACDVFGHPVRGGDHPDEEWPRDATRLAPILDHLERLHAVDGAVAAAYRAWREFRGSQV